MSRTYRELLVWKKAKDMAIGVYGETETFPNVERFGLTSQIRRAAVSVASNIAEGQGRLTKGESSAIFSGKLAAQFLSLRLNSQLHLSSDICLSPVTKHSIHAPFKYSGF
jgi:hypothetical protein